MLVPVTITSLEFIALRGVLVFSAANLAMPGRRVARFLRVWLKSDAPARTAMLTDKNSSALLNGFLILPPQKRFYVSQSSVSNAGRRSLNSSLRVNGSP